MELSPNKETILFGEGLVWHSRPNSASQQFGLLGRLLKRLKLSNSFSYPIFNLLIPIHSDEVMQQLNERSYLSVRAENYLTSEKGNLRENVRQFLQKEFAYACEKIWLQTLPQMFGYAFNPVSFWYCYKNEKLDAVVCEVNNTFGDRHFYFLQNLNIHSSDPKKAVKQFHVSPFMDISGYYTFEFDSFEGGNQVRIKLFSSDQHLKLDTLIRLKFRDFESVTAFYILKKFGWLTVMVIWRIHFQALKLWFKGAKFYKHPTPPEKKVTYDS